MCAQGLVRSLSGDLSGALSGEPCPELVSGCQIFESARAPWTALWSALSVTCPDLQRRIPAKCAAVPALSAAFSVSLVRKFCARPPRGSWTKPLNKAFFKLLLVRALSASSMAWVLPCSGLVRFCLGSFFSVQYSIYIYMYIYIYIYI